MIKTITSHSDLIQYAYNEKNLLESDRIQRAIDGDPVVQAEFQEIVQLTEFLDSARPEPSAKCIENILRYC